MEGAIKIYEDNNWLIVVPTTQESSILYGKETVWCTSSSNDKTLNTFWEYALENPLYLIIDKANNHKYQLFLGRQYQCKDEAHHDIDIKCIGLPPNVLQTIFDNNKSFTQKYLNSPSIVEKREDIYKRFDDYVDYFNDGVGINPIIACTKQKIVYAGSDCTNDVYYIEMNGKCTLLRYGNDKPNHIIGGMWFDRIDLADGDEAFGHYGNNVYKINIPIYTLKRC